MLRIKVREAGLNQVGLFGPFSSKPTAKALAREVVNRAIRKKYPDKPSEYHNLQALIYWNEALF